MAADEKQRKPMQAREEVQQRRQEADYSPPPRTRFIFKLLGLILVVFAGWLAWYFYRCRARWSI